MIARAAIILWLAFAAGGAPVGAAAEAEWIGIEGRLTAELGRGDLQPKPLDDRTPLILRVVAVTPLADGRFRYEFHYIGFEPGVYRLADYLVGPAGEAAEPGEWMLPVRSVLPADHDGSLAAFAAAPMPRFGGYKALLAGLAGLWVAGLAALVLAGRRRAAPAPPPPPRPATFAERLRPLVSAAADGTLDVGGRAELERLLTGYWRVRLALPPQRMAATIAALRSHAQAGELLAALERWLHRPGGARPARSTPCSNHTAAHPMKPEGRRADEFPPPAMVVAAGAAGGLGLLALDPPRPPGRAALRPRRAPRRARAAFRRQPRRDAAGAGAGGGRADARRAARAAPPRDARVLNNIILCLDVSGSMSSPFGRQGTRFEAAAEAARAFCAFRKGDAFGLTIFGSEYIHWVPPTRELSAIASATRYVRPNNMPGWMGGTMIANALRGCLDQLRRIPEGDRAVILISDGGSSDFGNGGDRAVARELAEHKVRVFSILVGGDGDGGLAGLQTIAAGTGGKVFAASDPRRARRCFPRDRHDAKSPLRTSDRRLGGPLRAAGRGRVGGPGALRPLANRIALHSLVT
jgi:Mg-chelatase subunit ChlD